MAKFLTGNELNLELEKLFEKADEQIILISPLLNYMIDLFQHYEPKKTILILK